MSKGSTRRPSSVPASTVDQNWQRTFNRWPPGMLDLRSNVLTTEELDAIVQNATPDPRESP